MSQKDLDRYKKYYEDGAWSKKKVQNLLKAGAITLEEYRYITGGE